MILLIFCTCLINSMSAQNKLTYNTKINNANVVNIKNGNVTIGKLIVNKAHKHSMFYYKREILKGEKKDTIILFFRNPDNAPSYNIKLETKFPTPVDTAYFSFTDEGSKIYQSQGTGWWFNAEKTFFQVEVNQLNPGTGIKIIYIGTPNIIPLISGAGKLD